MAMLKEALNFEVLKTPAGPSLFLTVDQDVKLSTTSPAP